MSGTNQGNDLAVTVGRNIRRARLARGLKQLELARLVGDTTSGQQVSDWERGTYRPNDANLLRLSEALGREYAWFFGNHDDDPAAVAA